MSRYPVELLKDQSNIDRAFVGDKTIKAICNVITTTCVETFTIASMKLSDIIDEPGQTLSQREMQETRNAQRNDTLVDRWRRAAIDKKIPEGCLSKVDLTMKKQFKNLRLKRGILFRIVHDDGNEIEQLVVPEAYREEILKGLHDDVGHPGQERTLRLMRDRFYWPKVGSDVVNWVSKCDRCIRRKSRIDKAPLVNIQSSYPLELLCIGFLTLEPSKGNFGNVLVVTDHYTKFAKAIPTRNQTAKTTAEALFNDFIVHFGIPTRLHSDQGANFESEVISELCKLTNMKKSHTTPYHPQGNAGPERFNRTLLSMLGTLEEHKKSDWKKYINSLVYFYNCTPHETTKFTPFELLFGRKPKLPIDLAFEKATSENHHFQSSQEFIQDLQERMERTHQIVKEHMDKAGIKRKVYYDKKAKSVKISIGDKVLIKKLSFEGKHKIQDKFEKDVYEVIEQPRIDIPVYRIRSEETGQERTLHRNHLLRLDFQNISGRKEALDSKDIACDVDIEIGNSKEQGYVTIVEDTDSEGDDADIASCNGDAHVPESVCSRSSEVDETHVSSDDDFDSSDSETSDDSSDDDCKGSNKEAVCDRDGERPVKGNYKDDSSLHHETEAKTTYTLPDHHMINRDDGLDDRINEEEGMVDTSVIKDESEIGVNDEKRRPDELVDVDKDKSDAAVSVPAPRRSTREKKMPDRYGDVILYKMTDQSFKNQLHDLTVLVQSGVLYNVSSDTARALVMTLLK